MGTAPPPTVRASPARVGVARGAGRARAWPHHPRAGLRAGETSFLAAERLGSDGKLISTDVSPSMVDVARRGSAKRG